MKTNEKTDLVAIGRVSAPSGLRGEFRINLYAQDSLNLKEGKHLLFRHVEAASADERDEFRALCKSVRYQKDRPVIRAEGIDDRNAAEELRGMEICIEAEELEELAEGEHYVRDIIGCRVVDLAAGEEVGTLKDVIQNTAQSVLEVETSEGKLVLIPAVDAFVRRIDEEERLIEVELIPGFIE